MFVNVFTELVGNVLSTVNRFGCMIFKRCMLTCLQSLSIG